MHIYIYTIVEIANKERVLSKIFKKKELRVKMKIIGKIVTGKL